MAKEISSESSLNITALKISVILAGVSFLANAMILDLPLIQEPFRVPAQWVVIAFNLGVGIYLVRIGAKIKTPKN